MRMSLAVDELAKSMEGKQALAVEAFASAMRQLPTIIADNAGYDSAELITNLRAAVTNGKLDSGLNMYDAKIGSMAEMGITECLRVKE